MKRRESVDLELEGDKRYRKEIWWDRGTESIGQEWRVLGTVISVAAALGNRWRTLEARRSRR
jgi:hypothetical protein